MMQQTAIEIKNVISDEDLETIFNRAINKIDTLLDNIKIEVFRNKQGHRELMILDGLDVVAVQKLPNDSFVLLAQAPPFSHP